ncbi:NUDIX hydrolase [Aquimarina spongiae]|uniref:NUDIX domain-containing protein n=1 Tax=Aquimarina spongiae TaxID=570521 RepID=A0A1M6GGP0_9FLAO|nr:NUDIX hydrolase [Aquimarina spongiae]SHJ09156.1 NUDIX domain-containing protein [Aquimarina spongiae]
MKIKKHKQKSRLIVYQGDELLVFQKISNKLKYGLVGGFLKKEETPEDALIREAFEETGVQFLKEDLDYYSSFTVDWGNNQKLSKHYFVCKDPNKPFFLKEPDKFRKIEWVYWKDTMEYLGKSDRKVIKSLFKPCKINY